MKTLPTTSPRSRLTVAVALTIALTCYIGGLSFTSLSTPSRSVPTSGSSSRPSYEITPYTFTKRGSTEPPTVHIGPLNWSDLPDETQAEMTMHGELPLSHWWFDSRPQESSERVWTRQEMDTYLKPLKQGRCKGTYLESCEMIQTAFKKVLVEGKTVLVIGSESPWIEAIALFLKASIVHTVDFTKTTDEVDYPGFALLDFSEVELQYDVVVSYSSLEHDGLGRYGDPIHPNGDLLRMKAIQAFIKPEGVFLLGVGIGKDALCWNAHRIYGPKRMAKLIEGYEIVDSVFASMRPPSFEESVEEAELFDWTNQPIFVLKLAR